MSKRALPILLIALFGLIATGCCDEQRCRDDYGLIDPSECPKTGTIGGGGGPSGGGPGPIITLGPASSGVYPWRVDGTLQSPDTDPILDNCELRYDFQGKYILKFEQLEQGASVPQDATKVIAEKEEVTIIIEAIGPKLVWRIHSKTTPIKKCDNPIPRMAYPPDKLPPEFIGLTSLKDGNGKTLDKIELQVEL